jgi:hypothetical protein
MIIYELTNKYINTEDNLYFSKYYATKDLALLAKRPTNEVYKLEIDSLGREEIASILSMDHVTFHNTNNGWHETHDISHITNNKEKIE